VIAAATGGVVIDVRVIPRASKAGLAGTRDDALLVRLKAPPVEGAANDELIELIAGVLEVPRRSVRIVAGERARLKRVRVDGLSVTDAARALGLAEHEGPRRT
jgi:uncharacterized protein (TIGR00251 family)